MNRQLLDCIIRNVNEYLDSPVIVKVKLMNTHYNKIMEITNLYDLPNNILIKNRDITAIKQTRKPEILMII